MDDGRQRGSSADLANDLCNMFELGRGNPGKLGLAATDDRSVEGGAAEFLRWMTPARRQSFKPTIRKKCRKLG
jgi:hypothetical protein